MEQIPLTTTVTTTPMPHSIEYESLRAALSDYLVDQQATIPGLRLGIAFVDLQTDQVVSLDGEMAHYALSTFKGPLGAFYFWLIEQGQLTEQPGDRGHLIPMLNVSSNPDTACIVERVGGLAPLNDWLALQGLSRERNFVFRFQAWACQDDGYLPETDWRYGKGDPQLGLPGGYALLRCLPDLACDKVFSPFELARFYARLYRGEVLNAEHTTEWLSLMEKSRELKGSAFFLNLSAEVSVRVYAKNGFRAVDAYYDQNFYNEAGIIETPSGAFALAVFMRGNPVYPGLEPISEVARIAHDAFVTQYPSP
jgi:hypothetical protein